MFYPFVEDEKVKLVGVSGGRGSDQVNTLLHFRSEAGVLHGSYRHVMNGDGQTCDVHSMSAGLDYPGVGPNTVIGGIQDASSIPTAAIRRQWMPLTN